MPPRPPAPPCLLTPRPFPVADKGQDLKKLFEHYDRDNSGYLDLEEFRRAVRKGGQIGVHQMTDEELEAVFDEYDADKETTAEGASVLDIDEFTQFLVGGEMETFEETTATAARRGILQRRLEQRKAEYTSELTFSPKLGATARRKKGKEPRRKPDAFYKQQVEKKKETEKEMKQRSDAQFRKTHTFQPVGTKLDPSTLESRDPAHALPPAPPPQDGKTRTLYHEGTDEDTPVFERLYTQGAGAGRHNPKSLHEAVHRCAEALSPVHD